MDIDITRFFGVEDASEFSGNVVEHGPNAGRVTWANCMDAIRDYRMLNTPELLEAFRTWLRPWGGWSDAEIAAMNDDELNALFLQWVASDMREGGLNDPTPDWEAYEAKAKEGQCQSTIYRNGRTVFFSLDH